MKHYILTLAISVIAVAIATPKANAQELQRHGVEIANRLGGATWADKINAAVAALPSSGGIIDARGLCLSGKLSTADANVVLGGDNKQVHLKLGTCTYPLGAHSILYFPATEVGGEGAETEITFNGPGAALRYVGSLKGSGVYHVYLHDFAVAGDGTAGSVGVDMTYALQSTLERVNIGMVDNGWKLGGTATCSCYNEIIGVVARANSRGGWLDRTANQNQIFGGTASGAIGLDIAGAASNQVYSLDIEGKHIKRAIIFETNVYSANGNAIVNPYIEAAGPILLSSGATENSIIGTGGLFERGSIIDRSGNTTNYFHQTGGGGGTHGIWPYYEAVQNGFVFGADPFGNSVAELSAPGTYGASQLRWSTAGPANQYGVFGHAPLEIGEAIIHSGAELAGLMTASQLPTPKAPTVSPRGAVGSTAYKYYIVCHDRNGGVTLPSSAGSTLTGNAMLSKANFNEITWTPVDGCWSWDILKGGTTTALAANQRVELNRGETLCMFKDTGQAVRRYRPPIRNTTGDVRVAGMTVSEGLRWPLPGKVINGASFYCPNCDGPANPPGECTSRGARTGSWVHGLNNRWICVP
jgi:hypothetical protein